MTQTSSLTSIPFYRWNFLPVLILFVWSMPKPVASFNTNQNRNLETLPWIQDAQLNAKTYLSRQKQRYRKILKSPKLEASLFQDSLSTSLMGNMPLRGKDGIYNILNEEQYRSLIQYSEEQNMLVVLKVFAPWCKACKKLEPKFVQMSRKEEYDGLPILWAQLTCKDNIDLIDHVLVSLPQSSSLANSSYPRKPKAAVPSVQLYDAGKEIFTFPCRPSNVPRLKEKLQLYFENEYEYPQHAQYATENAVVEAESNNFAEEGDAAVVNWAPWTRRRLFPGGPVAVTTSVPMANGQVDEFVSNAIFAV